MQLPAIFKFKLRLKFIIIFVATALLPLMIAMTITLSRLQDIQKDNATNLSQQIAQAAAEEIKAFIALQFGVLDNISTIHPEFSTEQSTQAQALERVLYTNENFVDLAIVNAQGKETVRKDIIKVITQDELSDRSQSEEFLTVRDKGYYLGPVYLSSGKPFFLIGKAIKDVNNQFIGAIFAQVDVRVMQDVVKEISSVGKNGRAYVINNLGIVIAHPDISQVLAQKDFSTIPQIKKLLNNQNSQSATTFTNELGQEVLGSGVNIEVSAITGLSQSINTHWLVIAEQPVSVALAAVRQITEFTLLILAIVLVASVIATFIFANRIVSPIEKVYFASKQFGQGNLGYRVNIHTNDEIEDLANQYNQMASSLQQNIDQLTSQNRLLTALRSLDEVALSTIDVKSRCQEIANLVTSRLGYIFGVIALVDNKTKGLKRIAISKSDNPNLVEALKLAPIPFEKQVIPLSLTDNLLVKALSQKESFYTEKMYDVHRGIFEPEVSQKIQETLNIRGLFIYPLIANDRVIGVIYYSSSVEKEKLDPLEFTIMKEFTSEVARIIDNALLYQYLNEDRELISAERNKLSVTLSGITDAVIAVDLNRQVVIFNNAAEKLTNYSANEVLGKPIEDVLSMYDQDEQIMSLNYCPIRTDGFEGVTYSKKEVKLVGKDGFESYANLISGQIKEGPNANLGCILTFHDITKEKQLEEMKLDFVSMAAHELRTPLTSVRGYLDVIHQEAPLKGEYQQFLERAIIASNQLVDLVENLLNVSRIERGAFSVSIIDLNWVDIVRQTVEDLTERAKEKKLSLGFTEPKQKIPNIKADKIRIKEVLSNLLSNAINYTQAGQITVSLEVKDSELITHVSDTGQGIPAEAIPHLFTKFFRVSGSLEQGSKGTGLGLYIAKSIIEMHKGRIWVDSKPGKGSTFSFALPITKS